VSCLPIASKCWALFQYFHSIHKGEAVGPDLLSKELKKEDPNLVSFLRIKALLWPGEKGGLCGAILG
jgi:hypothetical protein